MANNTNQQKRMVNQQYEQERERDVDFTGNHAQNHMVKFSKSVFNLSMGSRER